MPGTMRIRTANWLLRFVSLVTLATLVVAPACASLCSAQNCESSHTQVAATAHCHGVTAHNATPRIVAFKICASTELPAVVLTRTSAKEFSDVQRLTARDGRFIAVELRIPALAAPFPDSSFGPPHGFAPEFVPLSSAVLRI